MRDSGSWKWAEDKQERAEAARLAGEEPVIDPTAFRAEDYYRCKCGCLVLHVSYLKHRRNCGMPAQGTANPKT